MGESEFIVPQIRLIGIDNNYFSFRFVDTVVGRTVLHLRVATVWLVTASGMCYCSKILTLATLALGLLTQLQAQQCGV